MAHIVKNDKIMGYGVGKVITPMFFSTNTLTIALTNSSTWFLYMCVFILVISAAVYRILAVLCDKVSPGENDQFPIFFRLHHFICSDYKEFAPDIDFQFSNMTRGICVDRNVFFVCLGISWIKLLASYCDRLRKFGVGFGKVITQLSYFKQYDKYCPH